MAETGPAVGGGKRRRVSLDHDAAEEGGKRVKQRRPSDEMEADTDLLNELEGHSDGEDESEELPRDFGIECDQEYPYFKQVVLDNFRNHNKLTVDLNPRMNFIYGTNGSGKSAALIGLSVGLGCSPSSKPLKTQVGSFRHKAVITITIHQSSERYKGNFDGDQFGQDIIVERTITKTGGSSYKLMKEDRKTVLSTKKEVLVSILQFLGFQPDNPVQFMQQHHTKTFLHAGTPEKYFQFFARATRLQEFYDELVQMMQTQRALKIERQRSERQYTTFKDGDYDRAKQTHEGMQDALKLNDEIFELLLERLWAIARDAAQDAEGKQRERDGLAGELQKLEEKAAKSEEEAARHRREIQQFEAEIEDARAEKKEAEAGLKEAEERVRDAQRAHASAKSEVREVAEGSEVLRQRLAALQASVDAQRSAAEERRADRAEKHRQQRASKCDIPALEAELDKLEARMPLASAEVQRLTEQDQANVEASKAAKSRVDRCQTECAAAAEHVRQVERSIGGGGNPLAKFQGDVANIARVLEQAPGFARRPIGPVGKYIQMKAGGMQFTDAVSACLGWGGLQTFLVFGGQQDKARCEQALKGKVKNPQALRCDFANPDRFSHAKLGGNRAPCLLDVIEIDPAVSEEEQRLVLNYLVDRHKFNEIRIASTFDDANAIIRANPEHVQLANGVKHQVARTVYFWNPAVQAVQRRMAHPGISTYLDKVPRAVFSEDQTEVLQIAVAARESAERELQEARAAADAREKEKKKSQQEVVQRRKELKAMDGEGEALRRKVREEKARQRAEEEEAADEEEPGSESTEVFEREMAAMRPQQQALLAKKSEWEEEVRKRAAALETAQGVRDERKARFNVKATRASELAEKVATFAAEHQAAKERGEKVGERVERKRKEVEARERELAEKRKEHAAILEKLDEQTRVETDRSQAALEKMIDTKRRKIERVEAAMGMSKDVAEDEWLKAKSQEKKLGKRMADLRRLEEELTKGIKTRHRKYKNVLKSRKRNATWEFDKFIGQRDFQGRLTFSKDERNVDRMEPAVATQKNSEGQWEEAKCVKELSGGERSFSSLCMVLALSKVSGAPFLAMDEFDVFMDETNRTVGLRMLVDVLQKKRDCQTIVISPLSMAAVPDGPDITKIKMKEVDRTQNVLA